MEVCGLYGIHHYIYVYSVCLQDFEKLSPLKFTVPMRTNEELQKATALEDVSGVPVEECIYFYGRNARYEIFR